VTVSSLVVKILLACFKGLIYKGLGDESKLLILQRELTGTDGFKAVRGKIRGIAKIKGRQSPRRACEMAIGFIQ